MGPARVDTEVKAGGATAMGSAGETPVLLVNKVGKGRAVLMNFQLLSGKAEGSQAAAARELVGRLYRAAGARAPIEAASPNGEPLPQTETRVWANGGALVFGLWRRMENEWFGPKTGTIAGEPVPARVTLPVDSHVYDLRAGKYLGRVSRVDTELRWGRASFFLALPYRVGKVAVALSSARPQAGQTLTADITLDIPAGSPERFATWVEVTDPSGNKPLWGSGVVMLEGGRGRVQFPIAFNDQPGAWKVKVTELFSGQTAETGWTVVSP